MTQMEVRPNNDLLSTTSLTDRSLVFRHEWEGSLAEVLEQEKRRLEERLAEDSCLRALAQRPQSRIVHYGPEKWAWEADSEGTRRKTAASRLPPPFAKSNAAPPFKLFSAPPV